MSIQNIVYIRIILDVKTKNVKKEMNFGETGKIAPIRAELRIKGMDIYFSL